MLIDTHCHLNPSYFPEGPDAVLERGREAGVQHFVVIGVGDTAETAEWAIELAGRRDDVSVTVGMHPHEAAKLTDATFAQLEALLDEEVVVAVGEAGLDYHYMHSPAEVQQDVFRRMIDLAKRRRMPLVVHTRSAPQLTLQILEEEDAARVGGIIHCFSEDRAFACRALELDFDISLSGIVTFDGARAIQDVARWAPAERLMVETDAPYLSPAPRRGKRNEPANVVHTARYVAELRGERFEDFAEQTTRNAIRRLRLKASVSRAC